MRQPSNGPPELNCAPESDFSKAPEITSNTVPDPFDPASLRINQDFVDTVGVKKLLTTVPVRKPHKQDFVRVRSEPEFRGSFALLQIGDDREYYLVTPQITAELQGEFGICTIYTAINRQGTLFLWPVRLPGPDGRQLDWHKSAQEGADLATKQWVRLSANKNLGAYEIRIASGKMPDPEWPSEYSFRDLLEIGFRDRLIDRLDHPVIQQLRGLV